MSHMALRSVSFRLTIPFYNQFVLLLSRLLLSLLCYGLTGNQYRSELT